MDIIEDILKEIETARNFEETTIKPILNSLSERIDKERADKERFNTDRERVDAYAEKLRAPLSHRNAVLKTSDKNLTICQDGDVYYVCKKINGRDVKIYPTKDFADAYNFYCQMLSEFYTEK